MDISAYRDCGTAGIRGLDLQLIAEMKRLQSGVLSSFANDRIQLGSGAHDILQACAAVALHRAVERRGTTMEVNSAYRTIAQQFVLRNHFENGRCGFSAVADVGKSNHNGGLAIDIEDAAGWKPYLENEGWDWIGSFDPMHFDFHGSGATDIRPLSVWALQSLWNLNYPEDAIAEDGAWGEVTKQCLLKCPVDGFSKTYEIAMLSGASSNNMNVKFGTMRQGATGESVRRLQQALNTHGVQVTIDGEFGHNTTEAVISFQQKAGIGADGVAGTMTLKELGLQ